MEYPSYIPRVKMFAWCTWSNTLPSRANLFRRRPIEDPICGLCGEATETVDHVLLQSPNVFPIWYGCKARVHITRGGECTFKELLWSCMERYPPEYIALIAYMAWEIWQQRNEVYFEKRKFEFAEVIRRGERTWWEMHETERNGTTATRRALDAHSWENPPIGQTKMNSDIAVWPDGRIGLRFVLRDHSGDVLLARKKEIHVEGGTALLEGMAIRYALQLIHQYHFTVDMLECDDKSFVEYLESKARPEIDCDLFVYDVRKLMDIVGCKKAAYVQRKCNRVAHDIVHGLKFY